MLPVSFSDTFPQFRDLDQQGVRLDQLRVFSLSSSQTAIIVSGFLESDRVKAAQVLGAGIYVKKPYVIEKPELAVRKELDRK